MHLHDMHVRQAGGLLKRQGRYEKDDTARKLFISTVALPHLRAGVLPSSHDEKMLFLGPMTNQNLQAQDLADLTRWVEGVHRDPRARQSPAELDMKRQSTLLLLLWAQNNAKYCSVPENREGHFESGKTQGVFRQVPRHSDLRTGRPGAEKGGGRRGMVAPLGV